MQRISAATLLAAILVILNALPGRASTLGYTFDVVDVGIHFAESFAPPEDSADYAAFIDAVHPLAALRNRTFRMGVEITDISAQFPEIQRSYDPATEILSTIRCTFGPVCDPGSGLFRAFPANLQPATGPAAPDGTSFNTDSPFTGDYMMSLRIDPTDGSGFFRLQTDISDVFTYARIDGQSYYGQGPGIFLTLTNVEASKLTSGLTTVPLPAPALLLGMALSPLVVVRRKRRV